VRRRLLLASAIPVAAAVILLGVPLGVLAQHEVTNEAVLSLSGQAEALARAVHDRIEDNRPLTEPTVTPLLPADTHAVVAVAGGRSIAAGPDVSEPRLTVTASLPANSGDPRERSGSVTLSTSRHGLNEEIRNRWLVVAGLSVLAALIAAAVGIRAGRRLAVPLEDLARQAARIGAGNVRPGGHRYGINEVDRVAEALDSSMLRIAALLERERTFAADASHQLRTPLAALALRLEEIASSGDPDEMRAEALAGLDQVERLTAVVDGFLAEVRRQRSGAAVPLDVAALLAAQRREWEPLFQRAGRTLVTRLAGRQVRALATPGAVAQVVGTLLENALQHGAGAVTVTVEAAPEAITLTVSDEGPGVPPDLVPAIFERHVSGAASTGLGLSLARALVEADGGRMELVRPRPPTFAVFLLPAEASGDREPRSRA
jgi:signal transduction histidine kinase